MYTCCTIKTLSLFFIWHEVDPITVAIEVVGLDYNDFNTGTVIQAEEIQMTYINR